MKYKNNISSTVILSSNPPFRGPGGETRFNYATLFSGIGGAEIAAEEMGWNGIFYCEINPFGRKVLNYYYPNAISYGDITKTDFTIHRGTIDVLIGGFPCQDASNALQTGKGQKGLSGERTGLFYSMLRAFNEIRPKYGVFENVANLLKINKGKDFGTILSELAAMGYNAEWRICSASEVGAPHHRERLYMVAYPDSIRIQRNQSFFSLLPKTTSPQRRTIKGTNVEINADNEWLCESPFYSMDDGISNNMANLAESIKAYGNAIVPQVLLQIFKGIQQFENQ